MIEAERINMCRAIARKLGLDPDIAPTSNGSKIEDWLLPILDAVVDRLPTVEAEPRAGQPPQTDLCLYGHPKDEHSVEIGGCEYADGDHWWCGCPLTHTDQPAQTEGV